VVPADCHRQPDHSHRGGSVCPRARPAVVQAVCPVWLRAREPERLAGWACPAVGSGMDVRTGGPGGCRPDRSGDGRPVEACCRQWHPVGREPVHRGVRARLRAVAAAPRDVPEWQHWEVLVCGLGEPPQALWTRSPGPGGRGHRAGLGLQPVSLLRVEPGAQLELKGGLAVRRAWPLAAPGEPVGAQVLRAWRQQPVPVRRGVPVPS
jgi:hypothetical protein